MGNMIIGQSGGPTAVINSSLAGAIKAAKIGGIEHIYGMRYGIEGLLQGQIIDLGEMFSDLYDLLESRRDAFSCVYQNNRPAGVLQSSLIKRLKQEVFSALTDAAPERPLPRDMVAEHCCNVIYLLLSWNSLHDDKLSKDEAMEAVRHLLSGLYAPASAAGACAT